MTNVSWNQIKTVFNALGYGLQYIQDDNSYTVSIANGATVLTSVLPFGSSHAIDFVNNYLSFASNSLVSVNNLQTTGSGTITALNQAVTANTQGASVITFSITGTWVGTIQLQTASSDGIFSTTAAIVPAFGGWTNTFTGNSFILVPCAGYVKVQLLCTAYTSGTINISWSSGIGTGYVNQGVPAGNSSAWPVKVTDASNNGITSTAETSKQSLDVNLVAPAAAYYSAPVNIRQSATTTANATVWSMRNPSASTKMVYIERIFLSMGFDGATPLTRASLKYDLVRFSAATPTAGTAITVVAMDSSAASTQVTDVRFLDTGLTTTGVSFGTSIATIICPQTDNGPIAQYIREAIAIKLAPGEGFCVRLDIVAAVGQSLSGEIVWSER